MTEHHVTIRRVLHRGPTMALPAVRLRPTCTCSWADSLLWEATPAGMSMAWLVGTAHIRARADLTRALAGAAL